MNKLDQQQIDHHKKHYQELLLGGPKKYDGFLNLNSIWYWMHVYCLEHINEFFKLIPPSYFLTVADGYCGREAAYVKQFGHKVHASDIETCLIEVGYEKGNVDEYSQQDINSLSFDDETFDYVLVKESLHHLSRPYNGLYEMMRVSKKGIIIIEPNGSGINYNNRKYEPSGNYCFTFTDDHLIKIGLAYGYTNFAISYSSSFYGKHNIENIRNKDDSFEKDRLMKLDTVLKPHQKPLIISIFLKDSDILKKLSPKTFQKVIDYE